MALNGWFYDLSAPGWGVCFVTGVDGRVGGAVFLTTNDGFHRWFTMSPLGQTLDGLHLSFDVWMARGQAGYPIASPVINTKVGTAHFDVVTQTFRLSVEEGTTWVVEPSPQAEAGSWREISAILTRLL
jgi:hypothetical protein